MKLEKGYIRASDADKHVNLLIKEFNESIQVPGLGPVNCRCERGVMEVEIDIPEITNKNDDVKTYKG